MQTLQSVPGMRWVLRHPRLTAWFVLAGGMLLFLFIEARDIGLTATNWIALIVSTILVAGLCVWIVSWEDNNEVHTPVIPTTPAEPVEAGVAASAATSDALEVPSVTTTDNPEPPR